MPKQTSYGCCWCCYWHKNLALASYYSFVTRNRPTDQKWSQSTPEIFFQKMRKKEQKQTLNINLFQTKIQIKIIFYGLTTRLGEIYQTRKWKKQKVKLDKCQHRCLNVVEIIIILCSLLVPWSTKYTHTHSHMERDEPFKKCKNKE